MLSGENALGKTEFKLRQTMNVHFKFLIITIPSIDVIWQVRCFSFRAGPSTR